MLRRIWQRGSLIRVMILAGLVAASLSNTFRRTVQVVDFELFLCASGGFTGAVLSLFFARARSGRTYEPLWIAAAAAVLAGWGATQGFHAYWALEPGTRMPREISRMPLGVAAGVAFLGATVTLCRFRAALVGSLVLALWPTFYPSQHAYSPLAHCHQNQKAIIAAMEMYRLDNPPGIASPRNMGAWFALLIDGKYLQSIPHEIGYGPEGSDNYMLTPDGVSCAVHGPAPASPSH